MRDFRVIVLAAMVTVILWCITLFGAFVAGIMVEENANKNKANEPDEGPVERLRVRGDCA
jgi:Kef-type K+ transport system membrane component KefB